MLSADKAAKLHMPGVSALTSAKADVGVASEGPGRAASLTREKPLRPVLGNSRLFSFP